MIRIPFTYNSYRVVDGEREELTDILHFHMSAEDLMSWDEEIEGGLAALFQDLQDTKSVQKMRKWFTELVHRAYCEISPDGRRRIRDAETVQNFLNSAAWEAFFDDLVWKDPTNEKALYLIQGVFNTELIEQANALADEQGKANFSDLAAKAKGITTPQRTEVRVPQDHLPPKRTEKKTDSDTPWGDLPIDKV